MPADAAILDFYIETLRRLAPDAKWCAAGIGAVQLTLNEWSTPKGGHTRTGLEDNVRLDRDRLAPSNAGLARRAVQICEEHDRRKPGDAIVPLVRLPGALVYGAVALSGRFRCLFTPPSA